MPNPLTKYSEKIWKLFIMINPHHISCIYKSSFEDHATDILCMIDGLTLTSEVEQIQSKVPTAAPFNSNNCRREQGLTTILPQESLGTFKSFFINTDDDVLKNTEFSPWQTCPSVTCDNTGLYLLCSANSDEEKTSSASNLGNPSGNSAKTSNKNDLSSSRHPFGTWPSSQPTLEMRTNHSRPMSKTVSNCSAVLASGTKPSPSSSARLSSTYQRLQASGDIVPVHHGNPVPMGQRDSSYHQNQRLNLHNRNRKQSIKYPILHTATGHIQKYRDNVTRQNLRSALADCAHRFYAKKAREAKCVPKVHVECADVREGACIKPSMKVAAYKFNVGNQLMRCKQCCNSHESKLSALSIPSSTCCTHLNCSGSILSPVVGAAPLNRSNEVVLTAGLTKKPLLGSKEYVPSLGSVICESDNLEKANSTVINPGNKVNQQANSDIVTELSSASGYAAHGNVTTKVSRSRPSIPSNSRGQVYATAVETGPAYVVSSRHTGKSLEPKPIQLSFIPPKMSSACSSPRSTT